MVTDANNVNEQCVPMQANLPNVPFQIERASGKPAYWYTDGDAQYNGWVIDERDCHILAVRTPIGIIQPVRVPFGWLNSGIVTQGPFVAVSASI